MVSEAGVRTKRVIWGFEAKGVKGSRWQVEGFAFTELSGWVLLGLS